METTKPLSTSDERGHTGPKASESSRAGAISNWIRDPEVQRRVRGYARRVLDQQDSDRRVLQTDDLIDTVWRRMIELGPDLVIPDRDAFIRYFTRAVRNTFISKFRAFTADKRGGGRNFAPINDGNAMYIKDPAVESEELELMRILHYWLERWHHEEPQLARIVEGHYFLGESPAQIAEDIGISTYKVSKAIQYALAILRRELDR